MPKKSNSSNNQDLFHCPVCWGRMDVSLGNYADGLSYKTADCPVCGLSVLTKVLEDEVLTHRLYCYKMRELINQVIQGERARQIIEQYSTIPYDKTDQLMSLMTCEIPPIIECPGNRPLLPLSEEDLAIAKRVLDL